MKAFIITATKGRAKETQRLLDCLQRQTFQPTFTIIAGTEPRDLEGISNHPWIAAGHGEAIVSPRMGSSAQRNFGMELLEQRGYFAPEAGRFFCVFFDDDYRLADDWLEQAAKRFDQDNIVGLTGQILADGVHGPPATPQRPRSGLTEDQATDFISGKTPPESHWASGPHERDTASVDGCNMAFVDTVVRQTRFDENLPLYGWQEDRDYTVMAKKLGRVIYFPGCKGVHLGVKSGRTSSVKFGYSQIANPLYLMKKKTMGYRIGTTLIMQALAVNLIRGFRDHPVVDYRGRLRGNMRAVWDILCFRSDPRRIIDGSF